MLLALSACPVFGNPPPSEVAQPVRTLQFDIAYRFDTAAEPLQQVELYYTDDQGVTWRRYGVDDDQHSPMAFIAPHEGLLGFYVVATNEAGASSAPPSDQTEPHLWCFVDATPPVLQLQPMRQDELSDGRRVIKVRWVAIDEHFANRPISLHYRRVADKTWTLLVDGLSNTGRYDWPVPADVDGLLEIKVTACDRVGNLAEKSGTSGQTEASPTATSEPPAKMPLAETPQEPLPSDVLPARPTNWPQDDDLRKADRLFGLGQWYAERGEYLLAAQRWREALAIDPKHAKARAALGGLLYKQGDFGGAREAFETVLTELPSDLTSLRGLGLTLAAMGDYPAARQQLETFVERSPDDADAWLRLGDVALMMGDRSAARESWSQAGRAEGSSSVTAAQVERRLKTYP
jgi:TolA-binding protein